MLAMGRAMMGRRVFAAGRAPPMGFAPAWLWWRDIFRHLSPLSSTAGHDDFAGEQNALMALDVAIAGISRRA